MPIFRNCEQCQQSFPVDSRGNPTAKFCSRACWKEFHRLPDTTSICEQCHVEFPMPRTSQARARRQYCSIRCTQVARGLKLRGLRLRKFSARVQKCLHEDLCPYCCWEWKGAIASNGYGIITVSQAKTKYAHRHSWELHHQHAMPEKLQAAHWCHRKSCVNPSHVHAATDKENKEDSVRDLRHSFGEHRPLAKLRDEDIPVILYRYNLGETQEDIASQFHVSRKAIGKVVTGESWKHIPRS